MDGLREFEAGVDWLSMEAILLLRTVTGTVAVTAASQATERIPAISKLVVVPKATKAADCEVELIARRRSGLLRHKQRSPLDPPRRLLFGTQTILVGNNPNR